MSIVYVEGTLSPGALVCVMHFIDGVLDFVNIKVVTIPRSKSDNFTILAVPSGNYRVITFDLEYNSLPRMPISIAADSGDVSVTVSSGESDEGILYIYSLVCVTCPFIFQDNRPVERAFLSHSCQMEMHK